MLPSQETNRFWIYANNPYDKSIIDPNLTGKLMLFIKKDQLDAQWNIIKKATEDGRLGYNSKCSTAALNPNAIDDIHGLICVYTADYQNMDEIYSIEKKLRKLIQYQGTMYYKTDMQTMLDKKEGNGFVYLYKLDEHRNICSIFLGLGLGLGLGTVIVLIARNYFN
jgi:hypothetical protein